jgi:hypothetical protein
MGEVDENVLSLSKESICVQHSIIEDKNIFGGD